MSTSASLRTSREAAETSSARPSRTPGASRPERYHAISPVASEALASLRRHEQLLAAAGGLDVVVLGLGRNGHLGFNEPGSGR